MNHIPKPVGIFVGIRIPDVVISFVVLILGQQEVWYPIKGFSQMVGPKGAVSLAYLIASIALMWRRIHPLWCLAALSIVLAIPCIAFGSAQGLGIALPGMFAFYSVGRYCRTKQFILGFLIYTSWGALHEGLDPNYQFQGTTLAMEVILVGSGFLGFTFRARAKELQEASNFAKELELMQKGRDREILNAERSRIASELHDIVGHNVSLIVLQLVAAQGLLDNGSVEAAQKRLQTLEGISRSTMGEMRRLVQVVDADDHFMLGPQPGIAEIEALINEVTDSGIEIEYRAPITHSEIEPGLGLAVYRLVQEAITNVIKHAVPPDGARVTVAECAGNLTVEILDRGVHQPNKAIQGRGIPNMQRRVLLYGGSVEIGQVGDVGFQVIARIPIRTDIS